MLKTVNDMYKESSSKDVMLLSGYRSDFWDDYRLNYKHYDKLFRRLFSSFIYFMQEPDENISEVVTNFSADVYNHLLVNDKKYSELYRINVIDDDEYSLTDNYNLVEIMDKDTTSQNTNTYGSRSDSTSETEGTRSDSSTSSDSSRSDTTSTVTGSQTNTSTSKVAPYNTESFANDTQNTDMLGERTDSINFDKGAESNNSSFIKGEQVNSSTYTVGSHTDDLDNTSTENYTLTRKGNIGVQTATDMIDKHNKFWSKWDFYRYIFNEISKELLLV